mgnify:CR=1 FL=1
MTIFSLSPKDVHRDSVRRKFHLMRSVKIVQGLDQTDTAHLKQVVHILASVLEFLYDAEHQPQIARDKLLSQAGIFSIISSICTSFITGRLDVLIPQISTLFGYIILFSCLFLKMSFPVIKGPQEMKKPSVRRMPAQYFPLV